MYERHFGLHARPFALLPDPDFLYFSPQHAAAWGMIEYGVMQQAGFVVITGDIGTGKTTLVRYLASRVPADVTVGLIVHTHPEFGGLLPWVADAFHLQSSDGSTVAQYRALVAFLHDNARRHRRALLIVDEGQNLDARGLEELRTLSNINESEQLLQIMLVGQPNLRRMLRRPELEQFAQRVAVDYNLQPLNGEQTCAYVRHRLAVAGARTRAVFDDGALSCVYEYSRGVPRLVNLLCDAALVYGYAARAHVVDAPLLLEVIRDRERGGILPLGGRQPATA